MVILAALAALILYQLREILTPGLDRAPGTDAGILYSWELYTRSVLAEGRLPHWNPYLFGGTPHLADTETTVLYPPAMLLRVLPLLAFLPWMIAIHLWLAGAGTLFLARVIGVDWAGAAAAAIAVTFGGTVPAWLYHGHLLLIYCTAWLPWALGFAILSVRRRSLLPHPGLVIVLVLQLLAGYLQGSLYITATVTFYFLFSVLWPEPNRVPLSRWRTAGQLAVVAVLTAGVAAFQLFPTFGLAADSARAAGLPYSRASAGGWTFADLATLLFPQPLVSDRTGAFVGWILVCASLLAFAGRQRRIACFLAATLLAAVVMAFGDNLPFYRLHYALFPGLRIPLRFLFVATVSLAALGALGLQTLFGTWNPERGTWNWYWRRTAITLIVLLVAVDLMRFSGGAVQTVPVTDADTVRDAIGQDDGGRVASFCKNAIGPRELMDARRPTFDGLGGMSLARVADWGSLMASDGAFPARRDLLNLVNVSTVLACDQLNAPSLTLISRRDSVWTYRNDAAWPRALWTCGALTSTRRQVIEQLRSVEYDDQRRFVRRDFVNIRWTAGLTDSERRALETRYGLVDGEHREATTWRYQASDVSTANLRALIADPSVEDTHGLDRLTGSPSDTSNDEEDEQASQLLIGAVPCAERADVDLLVADQPDGRVAVSVNAPVDGILFFSEPFYSERQAIVDGERVRPAVANVAFTAVPVPAGLHRVELRLVPSTFYAGAATSAVTIGLWGAITARLNSRRRARLRASRFGGQALAGTEQGEGMRA